MDTYIHDGVAVSMPESLPMERNPGLTLTEETALEPEARLATLVRRLAAESPVDSERVRRFADQIRAGTYQSDPRRMADRLISLELLLP